MKSKTPITRKFFNIAWQRCVMNPVWFLLMAISTTGYLLICSGCAINAKGVNAPQSDTEFQNDNTSSIVRFQVETHADRLLKEMGDYLKSAEAFTFHAESSYDAIDRNGQNIRYGGTIDVALSRPNRFRSTFNGDERQTQTFYDGKTVTIYNAEINMYAVTDVPPDIDGAIDMIVDKYEVSVPLADIVYADPYNILIENVIAGRWVGRHSIAGVPCNHLAFIQESVDWQIWIEEGSQPVPRQVLITYKDEPGWPQYLARLNSWDFQPQLSNDYFQFQPPAGSDEMEFLGTSEMEVNNE
ncbi:MAG: DUF2092 domain-containing protein [Planctomycetes bacterium]|nr:DUF2092 domain-containing protein [Planctomycetota bacterium]